MSQDNFHRIALIGFGEAGSILGADFAARSDVRVSAYDLKLDDAKLREAMKSRMEGCGVEVRPDLEALLRDADMAISAVTAASARDVAKNAAPFMRSGQTFLDINSIAPDTKRANAADIGQSGAAYVDVAVMAPVPPKRLGVPMLLGGPEASDTATLLRALGCNAKAISQEVGEASAIKMCRSIMIKGLEALTMECMFTARHYGVEEAVLQSLHASFPEMGWDGELPDYLISRIAEHGRRRAAEVREVAVTVSDSGQPPLMADAVAEIQDRLVDRAEAAGLPYSDPFRWREFHDRLLKLEAGG